MKYSVGMKIKKIKQGNGGIVGTVSTITSAEPFSCRLSNEGGIFTTDYLDENYAVLPESAEHPGEQPARE